MLNKYKNEVRRGEIWLIDFGRQDGSEQSGIRPAVIISNNMNNRYSPVIQAIPITTAKKTKLPVHVRIGTNTGIKKPSIELAEQDDTRDKKYLISKIGECDEKTLLQIEAAILIQKGMDVNNHIRIA